MTEEEQELWMEIISEKHKKLLIEIKSSKTWAAMSSNARAVYPVIVIFSDRDRLAFLSIKQLEAGSGISHDAVIKALKELKEIRLIMEAFPNGGGICGKHYMVCYICSLRSTLSS